MKRGLRKKGSGFVQRLAVAPVGFTIFHLRSTPASVKMTKYTHRLKSSSGVVPFSFSCCFHQTSIVLRTAPYRSQKLRVTRPGARVVLKPRQRPHATRESQQEAEELAFYRRIHAYRDDVGNHHQNGLEEDDGGEWGDESTLIAMLQDEYVAAFPSLCALDALYLSATHSRARIVM